MSEIKKSNRYVLILLTRYNDRMSKVILRMMGGQYVHASLGLDDSYIQFYSFNKKGFRLEHQLKPHHREVSCALYRIKISDVEHARLIDFLNHFEKYSTQYNKYSLLMSAFLGTCQLFLSVFAVCGNISTVLGFSETYQHKIRFKYYPNCIQKE